MMTQVSSYVFDNEYTDFRFIVHVTIRPYALVMHVCLISSGVQYLDSVIR